jgi:hypothetical protein
MDNLESKSISQLLLSPLFLLNEILGTVVPGALLLLLLGLKGNVLLREGWMNPLFGYKTKIAISLLLAFIFGKMLRLPFHFIGVVLRRFKPEKALEVPDFLKGHSESVRQMVVAAMTEGVLVARPVLMDRVSLLQSDVTFHIGLGTALVVAACIHGDGSFLREIEAILGLGMLLLGFAKSVEYQERTWSAIGIGLVDIIGNMTPEQVGWAQALMKSLRSSSETTPSAAPPLPDSSPNTP